MITFFFFYKQKTKNNWPFLFVLSFQVSINRRHMTMTSTGSPIAMTAKRTTTTAGQSFVVRSFSFNSLFHWVQTVSSFLEYNIESQTNYVSCDTRLVSLRIWCEIWDFGWTAKFLTIKWRMCVICWMRIDCTHWKCLESLEDICN